MTIYQKEQVIGNKQTKILNGIRNTQLFKKKAEKGGKK